jgi:iron complex transport system permease protein
VSRVLALVLCLLGALALVSAVALMVGTPTLSPPELWTVLAGGGERVARITVLQLRLPRLGLGALAGASLALSGTLLQGALRNPLAGPELLGVSAGASAVMAVIIVFGLPIPFVLQPWLALAGALAGGAVVLLVSRLTRDPVRLILVGAATTALLDALVITLLSLGNRNSVSLLLLFLLGSLANRTWEHVQLVLPWAALGIPLALLAARPLNLLLLGDEVAEGLGLRVLPTRLLLMLLAAAMVAAVVAVCGPVGWVALLAPHLVRRALGSDDARLVLPLSSLAGVVLLLTADLAGRLLFAPVELPVGLWTTLLGGPLILVMLRRELSGRRR